MSVPRPLLALALAGCLPPDTAVAPKPPPAIDPDAELFHRWRISTHVLAEGAALTDGEAVDLHDRTVEVRADGYVTPWHGTCEDAGHTHRTRDLVAIAEDVRIPPSSRHYLTSFGLAGMMGEYHLTCNGTVRTPPLTIFVGGERAMTCFSGVCYLLVR